MSDADTVVNLCMSTVYCKNERFNSSIGDEVKGKGVCVCVQRFSYSGSVI